jgi:hypothetical protein
VAADEAPSPERQAQGRQQLVLLSRRLQAMPRKRREVFVLVRSLRRSGWRVRRESDGVSFRMSNRQLAKAELLPAESPPAPPQDQGRHQAQCAEGERVL